MPVDAELQDEVSIHYEMTDIDDVKEALQQSAGVKILVLDACRNNPLADKFVRSVSVTTRDIPHVQGYARAQTTQGMIIVYATQADDVANDGHGRNSPFSAAFLKEIKEPGLEIAAMFRRISNDVYEATSGRQSPELSISMVPDYYLNQSERLRTSGRAFATTPTKAPLKSFWSDIPTVSTLPTRKRGSTCLLASRRAPKRRRV